ncbi:MAG: hypothetical protein LQ343_004962 [Gyalolechia ehrenbergii]|nr:MAG: hypothetical protein LQ343_004962 [Gyalolechia ehrenbergii]
MSITQFNMFDMTAPFDVESWPDHQLALGEYTPDDDELNTFRPQVEASNGQTIDPRLMPLSMDSRPHTSDSGYVSQIPSPETDFSTAGLPTWMGFDSTIPAANNADLYYQPPMINAGAPPFPAADNRGIDFDGTPFHPPPAPEVNAMPADEFFFNDYYFPPQQQMGAAFPLPPTPSPTPPPFSSPQQQMGAAPPPQPPSRRRPAPLPALAPASSTTRPTNPLPPNNPTPIHKRKPRGRPPKSARPAAAGTGIQFDVTTVDTAHAQYKAAGLQTQKYRGLKPHGVKGSRGHERVLEGERREAGISDTEWRRRNGNLRDRDRG